MVVGNFYIIIFYYYKKSFNIKNWEVHAKKMCKEMVETGEVIFLMGFNGEINNCFL